MFVGKKEPPSHTRAPRRTMKIYRCRYFFGSVLLLLTISACSSQGVIQSNRLTSYNLKSKKLLIIADLGDTLYCGDIQCQLIYHHTLEKRFIDSITSSLEACGTDTDLVKIGRLDFLDKIQREVDYFHPDTALEIHLKGDSLSRTWGHQTDYLLQYGDIENKTPIWKAEIHIAQVMDSGSYLADLIITRMNRDGLINSSCFVPNTPVLPELPNGGNSS